MKRFFNIFLSVFFTFYFCLIFYASLSTKQPYEIVFNNINRDISFRSINYNFAIKVFNNNGINETLNFSNTLNRQTLYVDLNDDIEVASVKNKVDIKNYKINSKFFKKFTFYIEDNYVGELLLIDNKLPQLKVEFINNEILNSQSKYSFVTSVSYKTTRNLSQSLLFLKNRTVSLPHLFQSEAGFKNKLFIINQYLFSILKLLNGTIAYHDGYIFLHDINGFPDVIIKSSSKSQLFTSKDSDEYALLLNPSLELPRNQVLILDKDFNFKNLVRISPDYKSTDGHYIYLDSQVVRIDGYRDYGNIISYVVQEFSRDDVDNPLWEFDSINFYSVNDSNSYPYCSSNSNCVDYIHGNSHRAYDSPGNFLLSFRHLNSIVLYDRFLNKILWSIGNDKYFPLKANDNAISFSGQHDPSLTYDGNLIIYDNGTFNKNFARIVEIKINKEFGTYEIINILELEDVSMSGGFVDKKDDLYFLILSDPLNVEPKFQIFYENILQYELKILNESNDAKLVFTTRIIDK